MDGVLAILSGVGRILFEGLGSGVGLLALAVFFPAWIAGNLRREKGDAVR